MAFEVEESSGLASNFLGTITNSRFATDASYNNGESTLWIFEQGNPTDEDGNPLMKRDGTRMEITEKFSLGAGWEAVNKGLEIEHSSGNAKKKINASSWYGKVIKHVSDLGPDLMKALEARAPLTEFNADVWEGLRFRWDFEDPTPNPDPQFVGKPHIVPVEFVGVDDGKASKKAAPAAPSKDDLVEKLQTLARKHDTHDEFLDAALDVDGVAENGEVVKLIGKESFWAEANA